MSNTFEQYPEAIPPRPAVSPGIRTDASRPTGLRIKNGLVFVIKKLEALLQERRAEGIGDTLGARPMNELMQSCWMKPIEAVREWGVMPEGVVIMPHPEQEAYLLVQVDLGCALPGIYKSMDAAQAAAAQMILSRRITGQGEIVYRGQAMTPLHSFNMASLPQWPVFLNEVPPAEPEGDLLATLTFREGFPLLERSLFDGACEQEIRWEGSLAGMRAFALKHHQWMGAMLKELPLASLDLSPLPAADPLDAFRATRLYPEINAMPPALVLEWLKRYCTNVAGTERPMHERDAAFLVYLVNVMLGRSCSGLTAMTAIAPGYAFVCAWIMGSSTDEARMIARQVAQYGSALNQLTHWIRAVLARLERDDLTLGEQGERIALHNKLRIAFNSGSQLRH